MVTTLESANLGPSVREVFLL